MAGQETLATLVLVIVTIEGVWLAGLSYLMWRRWQARSTAAPGARRAGPK